MDGFFLDGGKRAEFRVELVEVRGKGEVFWVHTSVSGENYYRRV